MAVNKKLLVKKSTAFTPSEHFGVVLYEGDGSSSHSINGGQFGAGAYFNGSNSKIIYPPGYPFNQANSIIAVSAWVKLPTAATEFVLLGASSTSDSNDYITLIVGGNKAGRIFIRDASGSDELQANFGSTNDTNWNHYVWQLSATNGIELWVNGVSQTRTVTNQTGGMTTSSWFGDIAYASGVNYHTGINRVVSTAYYKAKVDQMRLFTKELSSSEVSTLYAETAATVESLDPLSEDTTDTLQVLGDSSCIATYRFENNEDDESGNYDGTGTAIQYAAGRYGQAASFNGSSSKITTSAKPLNNNTSISISFWAKNISVSDYATLIGEGGNSSYAGYKIQIKNTNDGNMALVRSAGGGSYIIPDSYYYDFGTDGSDWVHCVFTVSTTEMKYYKNGQNVLTQSVSNTSTVASTYNLNMMFDEQYSKYVGGQLDQVRIFNKTLSQAEVTTLYNENSLVASYRFEGNANDDTRNYDGTASNVTYEYGLNFTPDLVWIKKRDATEHHRLYDSTRGVSSSTNTLYPSLTFAASTESPNGLASLDTGGFTVQNQNAVNSSGNDFVAWCLKANGGTTSSNTDGSVTSTTQTNTDAGFSIIKWTGQSSQHSIGHSLGVKPSIVFFKRTDAVNDWLFYYDVVDGSLDYVYLNQTTAGANSSRTLWTSSVFYHQGVGDYIGYAFTAVDSFSSFGSYTGNGSNDGPIVETGFEPAFLMIKNTSSTESGGADWLMYDNKRSTTNPRDKRLYASANYAEAQNDNYDLDFLSNGFQIKSGTSNYGYNNNGDTYIYMAFAADPDTEVPTLANSFKVVTYTGSNSSQDITIGFKPDLVWAKARNVAHHWGAADSITGTGKTLMLNESNAQSSGSEGIEEFGATTIKLFGAASQFNTSGSNYVAYAWKADDNEPTINTEGSIDSIVSANANAGFSIVKYTGTSSAATVGHGLSSTPEMIIVKKLGATQDWWVYHKDLNGGTNPAHYFIRLNLTDGETLNASSGGSIWNSTAPTSTVFSTGTTLQESSDYIAYCFHSVAGYNKFGSYTGNGSTQSITGLGFQPDWIMIKNADSARGWQMFDSVRGANQLLFANSYSAESSESAGTSLSSFDSDGFTVGSGNGVNESGDTLIYMAFKIN